MKTQPSSSSSSPSVLEKEVTLQQFNELWSVDNCGVAEFNLGDIDPTVNSKTYIFNGKTNQFLVAEIEYPHPLQDLNFYLNDYLGKIVNASSILLPRTLSMLQQEFKKTKYNNNLAIQIAPNGKCPSPFKNTYPTPGNVLWKDVLENPSEYYTKKIGTVEVTPRQGGGKISKKYRKTKRRSKLINKKTKQRRAVKKYTKKSRKKKRKQKKQTRKRVKY